MTADLATDGYMMRSPTQEIARGPDPPNGDSSAEPEPGPERRTSQLHPRPLELERAENIAKATFFSTTATGLESGTPLTRARIAAQHHKGGYDESEATGRRAQAIDAYRQRAESLRAARSVPDNVRKSKQKLISMAFKIILIAGDSAVLGSIWWRAGLPLWLSTVAGVSTGVTMVAAGSMLGREAEITVQRRRRGPIPNGAPVDLRDLFQDRNSTARNWWVGLCALLAVAALLAVTLIGVAVGDNIGLAFSAGVFAALTLVGSAASEAYGTNLAADRVDHRVAELKKSGAVLQELEHEWAESAAQAERANTLEHQLRYKAAAAALTALVSADQRYEHPTIWGTESIESNPWGQQFAPNDVRSPPPTLGIDPIEPPRRSSGAQTVPSSEWGGHG